ncbi:hypothetical protein LTR95_011046, partial [Oleoguttula sp. CCFEE 5521]
SDTLLPSDVLQRLFGIAKSTESATHTANSDAPAQADAGSLEVSYPRLPFTPSFSQSQSFGFETQLRPPETLGGNELHSATELPPRPQMTQQMSEVDQSLASQNRYTIDEESQVSSKAIGSPQVTRDESAEEITSQMTMHKQPTAQQTTMPPAEAVPPLDLSNKPVSAPPKTPHRKSVTARLSHVPEVISAWFSPKSSKSSSTVKTTTNGHVLPVSRLSLSESQASQTTGLRTPHAYFPPVSSLTSHLNTPSQTPPSTVDLIAVITSAPTSPQRAKLGPRDYYTTFRISDPSSPIESKGARVEVFRHWKAVLPTGESGDVVLLRGFVVKGLKGGAGVGLRAGGEGAWCVWRFEEMERREMEVLDEKNEGVDGGRPRSASLAVREEVKGPPVEFGEAERERAIQLREWWITLPKEGKGIVDDAE